ncbi:MAG TPA: hypothetical protein VGU22_07180 [Methylomirabilota bacterium]|jgi:hypothetical protein|nr:hypothetical protein [Methylomirabilota bacterium]
MAAVLDGLPDLVNADASLVRRGRYCSVTFMVQIGDTAWLVTVHEGRITRLERGPFLMRAWSFAVRAPAPAWTKFWEPMPPPGFHDLFAMAKGGHATVEGDLVPLMANLRYVKDVLAAPRRKA